MQVLILAAGRGNRLGSLTNHTPKPLVKVLDRHLIDYVFDALPDAISECIVVVGYLGEQIVSYLGSRYKGKEIKFIDQKYPGTGGGLLSAKPLLKEKFLVLNADNIYNKEELTKLIEDEAAYGVVKREAHDSSQETVLFDSEYLLLGRGKTSVRNPRWYGAGAYMLNERIWHEKFFQLPNGEYSIPHTISGCKFPVRIKEFYTWISINTPNEIAIAESILSNKGYS